MGTELEAVRDTLPEAAKDIRLNLQSVLQGGPLTPAQRWGTAVAAALAARNPRLRDALVAEARREVEEAVIEDARAAAAIMAMNNIYYRFTHLASAPDYRTLPAKLRMNVIGKPGVAKPDFELWSLAVSAINGCGMCIDAHERELVKKGAAKELVQNAVRIAAVVQAVAVTFEGAAALTEVPAAAAA